MGCPDDVTRMADMAEQITYLDRYLRRVMWIDRANATLRVAFPSAQAVTISSGTVTAVTSMTQKAGIDLGITEIRYEMKGKWNDHVRNRIT